MKRRDSYQMDRVKSALGGATGNCAAEDDAERLKRT